jgi:hypothetical protein
MSRVSSTAKTLSIALALSLAGAGAAQAATTTPDAATERQLRANLAANPGSVRTGANQIQLEPGVTMTLPDRGSAKAAQRAKCKRGYFCIYENVNFGGAHLDMSRCKTYILQSYRFKDQHGRWDRWREEASSWINNQTGGVAATLTSAEGRRLRAPIGRDNHMGSWHDQSVAVKPC